MGQTGQTSPRIEDSTSSIYDATRSPDPDALWTPPPGVVMHNGEPIPETMVFFEPPPGEIGEIVTAHSTVTRGMRYSSVRRRWVLIGIGSVCLAAVIITIGLTGQMGPLPRAIGVAVFGVVFGGLQVGLALWLLSEFRQCVTYVGRQGVFRAFSPRNGTVSKREQFLFASASDLYVSMQTNYADGIYADAQYTFRWNDHLGKKVFKIKGSDFSSKNIPAGKSLIYFARSAESVWNDYLLELIKPELESEGKVLFRANSKGDFVSVGSGFLEFYISGKKNRIAVEEIGKVFIKSGWLHIRHKDVKWFSGKGKFAFRYRSFSNATLFLFLLEKLCGYKSE